MPMCAAEQEEKGRKETSSHRKTAHWEWNDGGEREKKKKDRHFGISFSVSLSELRIMILF
jgi:hypothetical protein